MQCNIPGECVGDFIGISPEEARYKYLSNTMQCWLLLLPALISNSPQFQLEKLLLAALESPDTMLERLRAFGD